MSIFQMNSSPLGSIGAGHMRDVPAARGKLGERPFAAGQGPVMRAARSAAGLARWGMAADSRGVQLVGTEVRSPARACLAQARQAVAV